MASPQDGTSALRTAGNSSSLVTVIVNVLPVAIGVVLLLSVYFVFQSLRNAHKRPVRAAIVPLLVFTVRYIFSNQLPLMLEPIVNSSYPPPTEYLPRKNVSVCDLHCDAMLWTSSSARSLLQSVPDRLRGGIVGSVDLPRLRTGFSRLQVFAAVTSSPRSMNFESNHAPTWSNDILSILAVLEWPISTYFDTLQRALHQAKELHKNAAASYGQLKVVTDRKQLENVWNDVNNPVAALLAVEGLHVLNNRINNVDVLFDAGYRILGPVHFFDSEVGGSSSGVTKGGLTEFGNDVVARIKQRGMIIDVAHSSVQLITDLLELPDSQRPAMILSHTGVSEVCPTNRNYAIKLIGELIQRGALIGITLFRPALCGEDLVLSFVRTVVYVVESFGVDNVCLGSDWDGAVHTAVDTANVQVLAEALRRIGNFTDDDVEKIMFRNARNFFLKWL